MSYGKDRVRGNGQNEFDADIIIRNGNIIAPESLTNQCRNTQKTMRILRSMGTVLGSYQTDYDIFPLASSMVPFSPQVVSRFYYIDVYTDAWGTPIEYKTFNRGADYELRSLGKDRLKGNGSSVFDADILFQDGQLLATLPDDCPDDPCDLLRRTRADMRAIATALGSYQVDYDVYPAFPMQINLCDTPLFSQYTKFYYSGPCRDAWNTPYQYLCPDGQSYTVTSYGKDGKPGVTNHELDTDILYSNGQLVTMLTSSACPEDPCVLFKRTQADMRAIGTALGSYQVDYDTYPIFPTTVNLCDTQIVPRLYYNWTCRDGWNTPYSYVSESGESYTLTSYGKDSKPGVTNHELDTDIFYLNGIFVSMSTSSACPGAPYTFIYLIQQTNAGLRAIGTALGSYQVDYDAYPVFPTTVNFCDTQIVPRKYYAGLCLDAWNRPYQYRCTSGLSYTVTSYGKDGKPGVTNNELDQDLFISDGQLMTP